MSTRTRCRGCRRPFLFNCAKSWVHLLGHIVIGQPLSQRDWSCEIEPRDSRAQSAHYFPPSLASRALCRVIPAPTTPFIGIATMWRVAPCRFPSRARCTLPLSLHTSRAMYRAMPAATIVIIRITAAWRAMARRPPRRVRGIVWPLVATTPTHHHHVDQSAPLVGHRQPDGCDDIVVLFHQRWAASVVPPASAASLVNRLTDSRNDGDPHPHHHSVT